MVKFWISDFSQHWLSLYESLTGNGIPKCTPKRATMSSCLKLLKRASGVWTLALLTCGVVYELMIFQNPSLPFLYLGISVIVIRRE